MIVGAPPADPLQEVLRALRARPRRRRLADDIEAVLGLIPTEEGQPAIHRADLMRLTGLNRARIAHVVKYIRHNIPEIGDALVSGPAGYRRTLDEASVAAFRHLRLGNARTTIVTVRRVIEPVFRQIEPTASREDRGVIASVRINLDAVVAQLGLLV